MRAEKEEGSEQPANLIIVLAEKVYYANRAERVNVNPRVPFIPVPRVIVLRACLYSTRVSAMRRLPASSAFPTPLVPATYAYCLVQIAAKMSPVDR